MMKKNFALLLGFILFTLGACSGYPKKKIQRQTSQISPEKVTQERINMMTDNWPVASRNAINFLTAKYGLPQSISEEMIMWERNSPFKRTVVFKEEVSHQFPMNHSDILQQTINYRVPNNMISELSKLDGSLIVDRTKGELSARNEKEEMNILSLNLADKIIRGEMGTEEARREYARNAEAFEAGSRGPLVTQLGFELQGNTSDPDIGMQSQKEWENFPKTRMFDSKKTKKAIKTQE
jgi:hypothetical protein